MDLQFGFVMHFKIKQGLAEANLSCHAKQGSVKESQLTASRPSVSRLLPGSRTPEWICICGNQ